jgi:hypothetical protein
MKHYWHHAIAREAREKLAKPVCDPDATIGLVSRRPQEPLSWVDRAIAFLTTPFKFLGISGWKETGCNAEASGRLVHDAQHSTDGFWTIDVALESFSIGSTPAGAQPPKFVRVEVEPRTAAHAVCAASQIAAHIEIAFGGPVVIDTDGPFLEVHPDGDFRVLG